jgi:hypothetical protein
LCKQIGLTAREAEAVAKAVSANAISDGKVIAGVWMDATEKEMKRQQ